MKRKQQPRMSRRARKRQVIFEWLRVHVQMVIYLAIAGGCFWASEEFSPFSQMFEIAGYLMAFFVVMKLVEMWLLVVDYFKLG